MAWVGGRALGGCQAWRRLRFSERYLSWIYAESEDLASGSEG
jgi:hypothetical protein